jgi:hypothetical protein
MLRIRMRGISIVLLMLLFSISMTSGQDQNSTSDQQQADLTNTINNLEQMRLVLLEKLVAIIPVKEQFASSKLAASSDCNQKDLPNACTYTFKDGQTLAETKDSGGYLLTDSFKDNTTHLQLDTEYTVYNRAVCYTLIDDLLQVSLKVCYPCQNNTTSIVWLNQTATNITTGDTLTWTANCCGNITKRTYSKVPGRPFITTSDIPTVPDIPTTPPALLETCTNTLQTEARTPI